MGGVCIADGEGICVCRVSVGKPEGKRQAGRPRHSWEEIIMRDLQDVDCGYGLE
jgi:hypothetical protein